METVTIKVDARNESGKRASAALRRAGNIPCVIYGGEKSVKLAVNSLALGKALAGSSGTHVILQLELGDGKGVHNVMLKELQYHPITDKLVHADLLEIDLNKPIKVKLPLEFTGEAVGVKVKGGDFRVHMREMTVECMPAVMPATLKIDITDLDLNKVWHVSDIALPEGIAKKDAAAMPVVSCVTIKEVKEEVAAPAAEAAPAAGAEGAAPAAGAAAKGGAPAAKAPAGKEAGKK
ncbi:MAG: 50S ribosomal protein L25 [Nitrospinae bacterium]|nr:50S ribosomal protein L25 [Nitrospinota bacterium]